jgi:hypothetical protein
MHGLSSRASQTAPALFFIFFYHSHGFQMVVIEPMLFNVAARRTLGSVADPWALAPCSSFKYFFRDDRWQPVPLTSLRRGMVLNESLGPVLGSVCLCLGDSRRASFASQKPP